MNLKDINKNQEQSELIHQQEDQILQLNQEKNLLREELLKTKRKNQNLQEYIELIENDKENFKNEILKIEDNFEKIIKKLNVLKILFAILFSISLFLVLLNS